MIYRVLADVVVLLHFLFVLFVVFGGFLVLRWSNLWWVHAPAAVWGALIEFADWLCPLTPLENFFRRRGGEGGYHGGFVERYILSLVYPGEIPRGVQIALGVGVIVINLLAYALVMRRHSTDKR